ncbi:MAG: glyoxylate/hydroxypyruvate reductase A [Pseudomonadota bacterium]
MLNVQFSAPDDWWADYQTVLPQAFEEAGLDVRFCREMEPGDVDYLVFAANGPVQDLTPYTKLRAILNLWAGVEEALENPTLTQPLVRMVDPGLTEGMVEWVVGHVLRHHLGMDGHILGQDGDWRKAAPPLARDRRVTILGLGTLGAACAAALADLNFAVTGWSRSAKEIPNVQCLSGAATFGQALSTADILVCLLPLTAETENVLDAQAFAQMPEGSIVINPGRGGHVNDADLLAALDSCQIAHATLDAFRVEPLDPNDPFWAHPRVTVTPHIASCTRPRSAARTIAKNIQRDLAGEPMSGLVDRALGY